MTIAEPTEQERSPRHLKKVALSGLSPERSLWRHPEGPIWLGVLMFLAYAGTAVLVPTLPLNLAMVDGVIFLLIVIGVVNMSRRGSAALALWRRCMPWIFLIVVATFIPLIGVGLPAWALSSTARLFGAILAFFTVLHLLINAPRLVRFATAGVAVGWLVTVATAGFIQAGGERATGLFANPNYTGHFTVLATLVLVWQARRRWLQAVVLLLGGYVVYRSGSFGALAQVAGVLGLLAVRRLGRTGVVTLMIVGSMGALVFLLVATTASEPEDVDELTAQEETQIDLGVGFNQERFDRSRGSRMHLWAENLELLAAYPMGVGPNGVAHRDLFDDPREEIRHWAHADLINFMVHRGPLGLIGLVGLWVALWKFTLPYGLARLMFAAIVVAGLFRDTVHFRHVWLFFALAIAIDYQQQRRRGPPGDDTSAEGGGGQPSSRAGVAFDPVAPSVGTGSTPQR
ncbi:MAG: O-antigen ligase family protein [Acidimicrobiia bacterium]|nr:O-antigen ligase family protein [Acidimicrobiia bacterium]